MAKEDLKNNEELEESRSELRFEDIKKLEKSNNDDKNSLLLTTNTISSIAIKLK